MNEKDILDRFEELEAGRVLAHLDQDELREWEKLAKDPRCQPDLSLELIAAALEENSLGGDSAELPPSLVKELQTGISESIDLGRDKEKMTRPTNWTGIFSSPKIGWTIAALFAALLIGRPFIEMITSDQGRPIVDAPDTTSPENARDYLIAKAADLIESDFGGTEDFRQMSGSVVWSDKFQKGYMSLSNLPANDPRAKQYQLWIVDPTRDERPVDGGVFDISVSDGTAIILIRNPLLVTNPQAFVITLEQPGGVVVSKQEVVVALAKTS